MYKIKYSNLFLDDLTEAVVYIKEVLINEDASNNLKTETYNELQELKKHPHIGTRLYKDLIETKYRYIRVNNYYIFYYINNDTIFAERFIYAKRDFMKLLNI